MPRKTKTPGPTRGQPIAKSTELPKSLILDSETWDQLLALTRWHESMPECFVHASSGATDEVSEVVDELQHDMLADEGGNEPVPDPYYIASVETDVRRIGGFVQGHGLVALLDRSDKPLPTELRIPIVRKP